ncbi:ATP-binding cassette domain-containing protein [Phytomonospora endophytica]|uniref:ABC-2 type transport system ATP-binding protein n=1 Tax=Phytomonospora endophytica TaxID=714109 RepID=A0A841G2D7_9ACTN|nr:ATP-binding cassette domain-containing protein [Phytomonospora endophytica]MBB6039807.1 ABC-2 type transport system ATP-binding protein [Phytomonospora endophytica]GIG70339.1 daunorubicin resistance protein DrrA family ABC transporter ATP-binding protein [Phytomonospora endophytica]
MHALVADGLRKTFGKTEALAGFDLRVKEGTVCGLLGPNGSGKTTAIRIMATLLRADGGSARVAGFDVARRPGEVRRRIGLTGQSTAVDEILTGRENLEMWGLLYHIGKKRARRRAGELLDQFGLTDAADRRAKHYSGGMRRRLDLATSLILAPRVLFLDEPTTGMDPRNRNEVWSAVRSLVDEGTTVLLTTQYLDEADQLADRIAVLAALPGAGGRIVAEDTPDGLKAMIGGDQIDLVVRDAGAIDAAAKTLARVTGSEVDIEPDERRLRAPARDRIGVLTTVLRDLEEQNVEVEDVALRRPTLDEAFLRLTGQHIPDDAKETR